MAVRAEVVATDIPFGEGPVWCPDGAGDGTLVVTSVTAGALYRIELASGGVEQIARTGGGANGAVLASDGGFLVTQNGGVDLSATGLFDDLPPVEPVTPGLQRVRPDGSVEYMASGSFRAPNDLTVAADGTVYFTDPGHFPPQDPSTARVLAMTTDGDVREVAGGFWFCNGIAVDRHGDLVVVERAGLARLAADGSWTWVIERLGRGGGDGFCLDADGRFYVASTIEHAVRIVDADGAVVDLLEIPGDGLTTNCCFGGPDGRTLFATDALPGQVVAWEGMPVAGLPLTPWPAPP
jgi:gluconolactonase